ncbi:MAG: PilZ domain-containing protein [Planctomycetaceae bacterium]
MPADPWSRPTLADLRRALEDMGKSSAGNRRSTERRELRIPAELTTCRGNAVSAMTREVSDRGFGLIHRGVVPLGEAVLQLAGDSRAIRHCIRIEWCVPCRNGMFLSGGRLLTDAVAESPGV